MKHLLLAIPLLCSCSMWEAATDPVVDLVQEGAKPLTMLGAVWTMAEIVNPIAAGLLAGAFTAFWDTADAEEEISQLKESREATFNRLLDEAAPEMKKEILGDEVASRKAALLDTRSYFEKKIDQIIFWLMVAGGVYLVKQPVWAYLTRRRIRKQKLA